MLALLASAALSALAIAALVRIARPPAPEPFRFPTPAAPAAGAADGVPS